MSIRLTDCLLKHFQFGPEYTVVSDYGGDASVDIAAAIPTLCRSDVCIAELRAPVSDAKLARLPSAFTCFGQQISVSVQLSILAKAHLYQHRLQSHVQQQAESTPASSLSPRTRRRQQKRARAQKAALSKHISSNSSSKSKSYTLLSTLLPQLTMCLLQTEWLWGAPLTLSWILGVSVAGLGWATQRRLLGIWTHSSPSLLLKSAQALCSPQQQPLCKLQMVRQPQLCLQRWQTLPLPLGLRLLTHPCCRQSLCWCPQTFLTLQCLLLCAYGQRMLTHLMTLPGKQFSMCMPTLRQSSASIPQQVALACPSRCRSSWSQQSEQSLMMHPFTYCVTQTHNQTAQEQIQPQTAMWQMAPPCRAHQQQQLWQPPNGQAGSTNQPQSIESAPCSPWGGSTSHPRPSSLQLLSLNVNGLRERQKRAALFAVPQAGPWHVIALRDTHHATQAKAAQWCRERAGPDAPWDGPSFWAAGTSASRGVALLLKACPLLSRVSACAADPYGRFIAAQGNLSGSHVTMASVYAPVERQERAPFFQQTLLPAMPIGTFSLQRGDWNCVAEDLALVGGQPGTRQHGFQSGLLPFQQALSLQDAFRCLHPQAREFKHTATNIASSARIDRL